MIKEIIFLHMPITKNNFNSNSAFTTTTDDFGRTTKVNTKVDDSPKFSVNYNYKAISETNQTTNNVDEMTYKMGNDNQLVKYKYTYDSNGNIKNIKENGISKYVYTYDSLNQLTRVADASQFYFFDYTYDNAGNITEKKSIKSNPGGAHLNTTTITYSYTDSNWGDLLTKYDGQTLTYDAIGNPLSYRNGMTMSWSGRELKSLNKSGYTYSFIYNLDGLRTKREKKQGDTVLETVKYYYDDSNNLIGLKKDNTTVLFYYDSNGQVYSMAKGGDTYFFIKDLQGDIRKIIDEDGTVVATYAYDAWGKILAETEDSSIAGLNPFRYRGYVYDPETELYYLQSRYYDPLTGRFINADSPEYTDTQSGSPLSTNMFAYCENNPVNRTDKDGNRSFKVAGKKYTYKYDRNKAIRYAKKYWKVIDHCHLGVFWYATGYNASYQYFYKADCTNFISQCLFAGGIPMTSEWYFHKYTYWLDRGGYSTIIDYSLSWTTVSKHKEYVRNHLSKEFITIKKEKGKKLTTTIRINIKKYKIKKGDVVYFDQADGNGYSHTAIISKVDKKKGMLYYAAHSGIHKYKSFAKFFKDTKNKGKICVARIK